MEKLKFRHLKADEIDCRISTVTEKGVSLLLYKDARVDQNILDETVGPMNWQRRHCRENANCIVSLWDEEKKQWIEKEDTGKESHAEAEKGLASDSFKRACFNWGIGRELYTSPFIWVTDCVRYERKDRNGKPVFTCNDKFVVSDIGYDDTGNIVRLAIRNCKTKRVVYQLGISQAQEEISGDPQKLEEKYVNTIFMELQRTGIGRIGFLKNYKVTDIHDMTMEQYKDAVDKLKKKPDKPLDPAMVPPEDNCGLPFS